MRARFASIIAASCVACASPEHATKAASAASLIYGADDRSEVSGAAADPALYEAARAVAAVIPRSRVRFAADGTATVLAVSLADTEQLCADEPYAGQPSAAECTAALIDDNLLVTAGHCFAYALQCQDYVFFLDYAYATEAAAASAQIGPLVARECTRAIVHEDDPHDSAPLRDYAIIELRERVEDRTPLSVRQAPVATGEPLVVISNTSGLPLKVDRGARMLDPRVGPSDYFTLEADTFHGSSGAPILGADHAILGLFVRGQDDYVFDEAAGCYRVARVPSRAGTEDGGVGNELSAEHASYAWPAVAALCDTGYPSERLCGIAVACGDGFCSPGEDATTCGEDCIGPRPAVRGTGPVRPNAPDGGVTAPSDDEEAAGGCTAAERGQGAGAGAWLVMIAISVIARGQRYRRFLFQGKQLGSSFRDEPGDEMHPAARRSIHAGRCLARSVSPRT